MKDLSIPNTVPNDDWPEVVAIPANVWECPFCNTMNIVYLDMRQRLYSRKLRKFKIGVLKKWVNTDNKGKEKLIKEKQHLYRQTFTKELICHCCFNSSKNHL